LFFGLARIVLVLRCAAYRPCLCIEQQEHQCGIPFHRAPFFGPLSSSLHRSRHPLAFQYVGIATLHRDPSSTVTAALWSASFYHFQHQFPFATAFATYLRSHAHAFSGRPHRPPPASSSSSSYASIVHRVIFAALAPVTMSNSG